VREVGLRDAVTAVVESAESVTGLLKPFSAVKVIVVVVEEPGVADTARGFDDIAKSGPVTKTATEAYRESAPLVPVIST